MTDLNLDTILLHKCLLKRELPLLSACSGGPDSLFLADQLTRHGFSIIVAHFDHQLRPDSNQEAELVGDYARQRRLPFVSGSGDVAAFADQHGYSIEEAARILRYRFLFAAAETHGAQAVAMGHTADDRVETVLMHLLRGSGLDGLIGMPYRALPNAWSSSIPLVRPMLSTWREEVWAYLRSAKLAHVIDPSNAEVVYLRNRIRHELLPEMATYNPRVRQAIWRMAETLAQDQAALQSQTDKNWADCVIEEVQGGIAFLRRAFLALEMAYQRRLLRRAFAALIRQQTNIDLAVIDRGLAWIETHPDASRYDLAAGLCLLMEGERFWLASWDADLPAIGWPQVAGGGGLQLSVGQPLDLGGGWVLSAEEVGSDENIYRQAVSNADLFQAWIDPGAKEVGFSVRCRWPGARFGPLGLAGSTQKLSDFFVNEKMPQRARDQWPLVCLGKEIVWIPGYRINHAYRLTKASGKIVHLQLGRGQAGP